MNLKTLLRPDGLPFSLDDALPPSMDAPNPGRRRFAQLAGASMLSLPMVAPPGIAGAKGLEFKDNEPFVAPLQALFLENPAIGYVVLTGILIVLASGRMYYADVQQGARQYDEDRVASRILGGLTRPTIAERMAVAAAVGNVYIWGTILVVLVAAGVQINPVDLIFLLVHRQLSWEVRNMRLVQGVTGLPSIAEIQATAVIATVLYIASMAMLMAIVPPPANY